MRVLVASKFWYRRGGLERVMFDEIDWLGASGFAVGHFSTQHANNVPSPWSRYFVPLLDLGVDSSLTGLQKATAVGRLFYNREARHRFSALCDEFQPDIVHIHGIHRQISPSIVWECLRRGIPVVQTVHDYHHVCPADNLLLGGREPCEPRRCGRLNYGPAVVNRCLRGSVSASALSAAETAWQRATGVYSRAVSTFICPSRFMAGSLAGGGWADEIAVIPNAVQITGEMAPQKRSGYLFAGRIAREKGVDVACEAALAAGVNLTVAGEGPLLETMKARYPGVRFLGRLDGPQVDQLIQASVAAIIPSLWFENAPMSILEAMAAGTPVIASSIGGIPELLTNERQGLLVAPGDIRGFQAALSRLESSPALARAMGCAAAARVRQDFSPEVHMERLIEVYERARAAR